MLMSLPAAPVPPPPAKLANAAGDRAAFGRLGLGHRGGPLGRHLVLAFGGCGVVS